MSATFNQPNSSKPEEGSKEVNFDDNFASDPFEILVNPSPTTPPIKDSTVTPPKEPHPPPRKESTSKSDQLFDTSKPFNQNITTQDLFSDNFLNESFPAFDSTSNPFGQSYAFRSSNSVDKDNQELTKLNEPQTNKPSAKSTQPSHTTIDDFDKITHLNTQSDSNSGQSSDEIDPDLANSETGDFATIAIQSEQGRPTNSVNLEKNIANFNKTKKLINEKQLYLASCLLNDACNGLPSECNNDSKSLYLYSIYRHFYLQYLLYLLIVIHHSLAFFEELGFSREYAKHDSITVTIEFICLTYYSIRLAIRASFLPSYRFYSDAKNLMLVLLVICTVVDIIVYFSIPAKFAYRYSIVLRPFFVLNFAENRQIRRLIRNIRNTLPDMLNIIGLLGLSIAVFSLVAVKLFKDVEFRSANQIKAKNYLDYYYLLYVLVTTANNPELMMPAYRQSKWYAAFFVSFIVLNVYLFCNVLLATIYNNFRKHLRYETKHMLDTRKTSLIKSFEVMVRNNTMNLNESIPVFNENEGLNCDQFKLLMQTYFSCWRVPSQIKFLRKKNSVLSYNYLIQVYWKLLESNSLIRWEEYQNLCDLLNMEMKVIDLNKLKNETNSVRFPKLYNSTPSKVLVSLVKSKNFRYFFDSVILLNALLIAFDLGYYKQVELFLFLFIIEICMKCWTFNLKHFLAKHWNVFDLLVVISATLLISIGRWFGLQSLVSYGELIIILRVLRLSKWLKKIDRFSVIVQTVTNLTPYLVLICLLFFLLFYAFAIVGMQIFRNSISPELIANDCTITKTVINKTSSTTITTPTKMNYCDLNFNSISSSFIVLFEMLMPSWHTIADNYEIVVGSKFARLFFVSFHVLASIVLLNIFTAFILEAFILESFNTSENGLLTSGEQNNDLKKKIAQLGLECKASVLNLVSASAGFASSINEFDQLDADHEQFDYNFKPSDSGEDTVDGGGAVKKNAFSVISLSPEESNLVVMVIRERPLSTSELLFRMYREELNRQI